MKKRQFGFALITVMLVVSLVAIISAQMLSQQQAQVMRSGFMQHQAQSLSVAWGLESWVKQGLVLDRDNSKNDHLLEMWAQPLPPVPFAGGEVSGWLEDEQSKINLNNLLHPQAEERKFWHELMTRWLQSHQSSWPLADLTRDWTDADSGSEPFGAESDVYQIMQPPYGVANQFLLSVNEVQLFNQYRELTPEIKSLLPLSFSTLPKLTPINVNTASESVLMAFADWLTQPMAQAWIAKCEQAPAESIAEFVQFMQQQSGLSEDEVVKALPEHALSVSSEFFVLHGVLNFGDVEQAVNGLFYRPDAGDVQLLQRWLMPAL